MEKGKNIIKVVNYNLKENIYMGLKYLDFYMKMINQNLKENIHYEKNGMEKDMMKMGKLDMK